MPAPIHWQFREIWMKISNGASCSAFRPHRRAAFQLDQEPAAIRGSYCRGIFGQGCLLARRHVERGVSFVEVSLDGWINGGGGRAITMATFPKENSPAQPLT